MEPAGYHVLAVSKEKYEKKDLFGFRKENKR